MLFSCASVTACTVELLTVVEMNGRSVVYPKLIAFMSIFSAAVFSGTIDCVENTTLLVVIVSLSLLGDLVEWPVALVLVECTARLVVVAELLEEGEVLIVDLWVVIDNDRGLIVLDGVTRATKYSYIIQKSY